MLIITSLVGGSRRLFARLPKGTIISQKRNREEIDIADGKFIFMTNKRQRLSSKTPSIECDDEISDGELVVNVTYRPSDAPWMLTLSLSQGTLCDMGMYSIPNISIASIRPYNDKVFEVVKNGLIDELQRMLANGEASLRDHDEAGTPLLHVSRSDG